MGKITRLVVLSSELPSEMHLLIYELHADVTIKETCYGMMIHGEEAMVTALTNTIRKIDPGAFIKERGFIPGDPRRCRADRGGGARPGFYSMRRFRLSGYERLLTPEQCQRQSEYVCS